MKAGTVAIVGMGLIGGSLAKAIKKNDPLIKIIAYDKKDVLWIAQNDALIDQATENILDVLSAEIIFICLPVDAALYTFKILIPRLTDNQIITDVCGVKGVFYNLWNEQQYKGNYFGGHPMTGKEQGGYKNSDFLLFENSVYLINDNANENPRAESLINIIKLLGARILFVDPYQHDKIVANVSHLPQILAVSLVNSVADNGEFLSFAAGGFRDMTRIANSPFDIWKSVIQFNRNEILTCLDGMIDKLQCIKEAVEQNDSRVLENEFRESAANREKIPLLKKGFINQLFDILVFVEDRPGIISEISTALYKKDINIKDIELLKFREGSGGTFRLSFDSEELAEKAIKTLRVYGFTVN